MPGSFFGDDFRPRTPGKARSAWRSCHTSWRRTQSAWDAVAFLEQGMQIMGHCRSGGPGDGRHSPLKAGAPPPGKVRCLSGLSARPSMASASHLRFPREEEEEEEEKEEEEEPKTGSWIFVHQFSQIPDPFPAKSVVFGSSELQTTFSYFPAALCSRLIVRIFRKYGKKLVLGVRRRKPEHWAAENFKKSLELARPKNGTFGRK
eukprot:gene11913-biopygen12448